MINSTSIGRGEGAVSQNVSPNTNSAEGEEAENGSERTTTVRKFEYGIIH